MMKTSNIILLSIFLTILIGSTAFFFMGIHEAKKIINTEGGGIKELKEQKLSSFNTLIIRGTSYINITEDSTSSYIQSKDKNILKQFGDTLIINMEQHCNLHCNNIKSIIIEDNVNARLDVISSDTINIYTKSNSDLRIENIEANYINIEASANSGVNIQATANHEQQAVFSLSDNAEIRIQKTGNLKMELSKTGNSSFKIY